MTAVDGHNAVGLPNGALVCLLRLGGLVETMDSVVYDALTKKVGAGFVARVAWNKNPATYAPTLAVAAPLP